MTGTEKQIEYATSLLNKFAAELLDNGPGDECQTTRDWTANSKAFLATLTDDAHLIIEAFSGLRGFNVDLSDIREYGTGVWEEIEAMSARRPTAYKAVLALRVK